MSKSVRVWIHLFDVNFDLCLQDFILHFDIVDICRFDHLIVFQLKNILIKLDPLIRLEIELLIAIVRVIAFDKH